MLELHQYLQKIQLYTRLECNIFPHLFNTILFSSLSTKINTFVKYSFQFLRIF